MKAKDIINGWCDNVMRERKQNKVFPNVFLEAFEADILEITKAGYTHECEVKVSKADYKADFKKKRDFFQGRAYGKAKYDILQSGERVNRFSYVVPKGLISVDEVPEFAGLIYAEVRECGFYTLEKGHYRIPRMFFSTQKAAPKLSNEKLSQERMFKVLESTYYRFHSMRTK